MSAIGGIADLKNKNVDFSELDKMRLVMSMRGRRRSSAYIGKDVDVFYNSSQPDAFEESEDRQPAIFERGGQTYVVCHDSDRLLSSAVFENYRLYGIDILGTLGGAFSLAIFDGERKMLLLARDKRGAKPLFYRVYDGRIYFSSEIKGIVEAIGGRTLVSREMLSLHLTAPMGVYRATNLLPEICEVLAGECVIFTELGMSRFRYREHSAGVRARPKSSKSVAEEILMPYPISEPSEIDEVLSEALIAFDYPQFDSYMPSFCKMLASARRKGRYAIRFEDATIAKSSSYAFERQDGLGNLFGLCAVGIPTRAYDARTEELDIMREHLRELFFSLDSAGLSFLRGVLGERRLEYLMQRFECESKKEDTDATVRILGMLYQCVMWAQSRELLIKSTCDEAIQSALSMM